MWGGGGGSGYGNWNNRFQNQFSGGNQGNAAGKPPSLMAGSMGNMAGNMGNMAGNMGVLGNTPMGSSFGNQPTFNPMFGGNNGNFGNQPGFNSGNNQVYLE